MIWKTCWTEVDPGVAAITEALSIYGNQGWEPWYMKEVIYVPVKDGKPDHTRYEESLTKMQIWFKHAEENPPA